MKRLTGLYSDGTDLGEAVEMAKAADVAIVFVATLSHEGGDRGYSAE